MKKLLCGIFSLILLASCSNDDDDARSASKEKAVIQLNCDVLTAMTRVGLGPINSGFSTAFPIGIYANDGAWLAGATANWINNDNATVSGTGPHPVTFGSGPYYYPTDGSTLNFYAFAPQAVESTPAGAGSSPIVTHTIDGTQDVMWSTATGYKIGSAAAVPPVLTFAHKLTQLQFTFVSGTGYPASANKVVSLLLKAQPTTAAMNVATGGCTFSGSADMQALSAANQTAGISIVTAGTNANSPLMTNTAASYTMDIVVKAGAGNVTYTGVPVTVTSAIGSAHMITITFSSTAITATATVTNWATGSTGSASAS